MSDEYKRGYSKAYNTRAKQWPAHRPPHPPTPQVAAMMTALQELRDAYDTICATFSEDDELVISLAPKIDAADAALSAVSKWLRDQ
jgi:hypothetical protein